MIFNPTELKRLTGAVVESRNANMKITNPRFLAELESALSSYIIEYIDDIIDCDPDPTPSGESVIAARPYPNGVTISGDEALKEIQKRTAWDHDRFIGTRENIEELDLK